MMQLDKRLSALHDVNTAAAVPTSPPQKMSRDVLDALLKSCREEQGLI